MSDPSAVTAIVDRTGDPATVAWAHEGVGNVAALPDPHLAIAAATALGNVKALQSVTAPKDLKKAAAAGLHKLRSRGVTIVEPVAPRAFTLGKQEDFLPARAFLSLPDMDGDMELMLTVSDAEGNCALGVILGAGEVKETRHAHMGRGELRDVWKQAESRKDLAELPFVAGLHYADAALANANKHDWKHFLEHVSIATLASARVLDPLLRAPAGIDEGEDPSSRWLAPVRALHEPTLLAGIDQVQALVGEHGMAGGDDAALDAKLEAIYTSTADTALDLGNRAALVNAAELASVALTFHRRPRAAAIVRAQGEAAAAGAPGSSIEGVAMTTRLVLLSRAQNALQERMMRIDQQIARSDGGQPAGG
jgi:hypothetical protein